MVKQYLMVFLGGGLGSMLRFGISGLIAKTAPHVFPWATLTSNALSCVVLGLATGYLFDPLFKSPNLYLLGVVGFCGGFSTFSTFSYETFSLIRNGHTGIATANVLISIAVCLFIIYLLAKR